MILNDFFHTRLFFGIQYAGPSDAQIWAAAFSAAENNMKAAVRQIFDYIRINDELCVVWLKAAAWERFEQMVHELGDALLIFLLDTYVDIAEDLGLVIF